MSRQFISPRGCFGWLFQRFSIFFDPRGPISPTFASKRPELVGMQRLLLQSWMRYYY
jgi:hypothetical protein